jgi:hypothetical protein
MYVMQEDLARAHVREQLKQAEQSRRHHLALRVENAERRWFGRWFS